MSNLREFSQLGISQLEYTYIPGLDDFPSFQRGAELLAPYAKPHICIFRPWKAGQRAEQIAGQCAEMGPQYLCEMRLFYEELHGGPVYGNQLGNLWPFPEGRFNPEWRTKKLEGPNEYERYWVGEIDPRQRCRKAGCEQNCPHIAKTGLCLYAS